MTVSKRVLSIMLVLVLLSGLGSAGYFMYQDYEAQQALEENTEYQVLMAIEAQYPEIYVIAVQEMENNIFVYFVLPAENQGSEYAESLLIDIVTILYNAYPTAKTYHVLPAEIVDVDTFEGPGHLGMASVGFGFTNYAAEIIANETCSSCVMDSLFQDGEIGSYLPRQMGLHLILEATAREPGHIPPWAAVEE